MTVYLYTSCKFFGIAEQYSLSSSSKALWRNQSFNKNWFPYMSVWHRRAQETLKLFNRRPLGERKDWGSPASQDVMYEHTPSHHILPSSHCFTTSWWRKRYRHTRQTHLHLRVFPHQVWTDWFPVVFCSCCVFSVLFSLLLVFTYFLGIFSLLHLQILTSLTSFWLLWMFCMCIIVHVWLSKKCQKQDDWAL